MFRKLQEVENRFQELEQLLSDPKVLTNPKEMQKLGRERAEMARLVEAYRVYRKVNEEIQASQGLLEEADEEMRELAKAELSHLKEKQAALEQEMKILLLPRDPRDKKYLPGDPRGDRRGRGGPVCGRAFPHVRQVCRGEPLAGGGGERQSHGFGGI